MRVKVTNVPVFKCESTDVYILSIKYSNIQEDSIEEFDNLDDLISTIKVVDKYIKLLDDEYDTWCVVDPIKVGIVADMVDIKLSKEDCTYFFVNNPDNKFNEDYMCIPNGYVVTYVDKNGTEFNCKIIGE